MVSFQKPKFLPVNCLSKVLKKTSKKLTIMQIIKVPTLYPGYP